MISTKGFLEPNRDRLPRMTAKQCLSVTKAAAAAIDHWVDKDGDSLMPDIAAVVKRVTAQALANYPPDRSCRTCDFSQADEDGAATHCLHWKSDVPDEALEAGCDQHQEHGAPF